MLIVKKSRLKNAGKGLFTTSAIRKGDLVIEYKGEKLTWKQCHERYGEDIDKAEYLYYVSYKNCVDARDTVNELARYANDANGYTKVKGLKNNCDYDNVKGVPYIKAIQNIPAGSEIYVNYESEYWEALQEGKERVEKLKKKKEAQQKKEVKGKAKRNAKKNTKKKNSNRKKR